MSSNFTAYAELNGLPSTLISNDIPVIGGLDDLSASVWVKSQAGTGSFKGKLIADSARPQAVTDDAPTTLLRRSRPSLQWMAGLI